MSRADLLLSVLEDGQPHTRRDIQRRVGYFLTNNAASELRKRGLNVVHRRQGRVDMYQLGPSSDVAVGPESSLSAASEERVLADASPDAVPGTEAPGPVQLSIESEAAWLVLDSGGFVRFMPDDADEEEAA